MARLREIRQRAEIQCCEDCKKHGTVEDAPRIDFVNGQQSGPHFIPSDVSFAVTDASPGAEHLVGKVFPARGHIPVPAKPCWLIGSFLRDVC